MTVSSTINKSGPYSGNGVTTAFEYEFRILDETHLTVVKTVDGAETVLTLADYAVSGVGAQGGGSVVMDAPPATGETITIVPNPPFTQQVDLENQGAYYAETVERALDLAAMRDQKLAEGLSRTIQIPVSASPEELASLIADVVRLGDSADEIDTVAGIAANVVAVAGIAAEVVTVSGVAADVSTVAGIAADVTAVAAIDGEVTTVAGIAGAVSTVAGVAGAVAIAAAIDDEIMAVAANAVNINAVAGIEAEIIAVPAQVQAAEDARDAAEAAAAGLALPVIQPGDAGKKLSVKADETGFELTGDVAGDLMVLPVVS